MAQRRSAERPVFQGFRCDGGLSPREVCEITRIGSWVAIDVGRMKECGWAGYNVVVTVIYSLCVTHNNHGCRYELRIW